MSAFASMRNGEAAILAVAFLVRSLWVILVPVETVSDPAAYHIYAEHLASGRGYGLAPGDPSAFWPPGTAFFYSLAYQVVGPHSWSAAIVNVPVGVATVFLTIRLAESWFGTRNARISGWLVAVWPLMIQYSSILASELLFTLGYLAILLVWQTVDHPGLKGLGAGVCMAATSFIRPVVLPLPVVLGLGNVIRNRNLARSIVSTGISLVVALLLILPWSLRNHQVFGEFVLMSTNSGVVLWMGNNPNSSGNYMKVPEWTASLGETERDQVLGRLAREHIMDEPGTFIARSLNRLRTTWDRETIGVVWNPALPDAVVMPLKIASTAWWYAMLGLGAIGAALWLRREGSVRVLFHPLAMTTATFAAIYAVTNGQDRYHVPSNPMIAMLAAMAISGFMDSREQRPVITG